MRCIQQRGVLRERTFLKLSWAGYPQSLSVLGSPLALDESDVVVIGGIPSIVLRTITGAGGRQIAELNVATSSSGGIAASRGCVPVDFIRVQHSGSDGSERMHPLPISRWQLGHRRRGCPSMARVVFFFSHGRLGVNCGICGARALHDHSLGTLNNLEFSTVHGILVQYTDITALDSILERRGFFSTLRDGPRSRWLARH